VHVPSPLSLTAADYARACTEAGLPGGDAALERYARFYREGLRDRHLPEDLVPVAPVHRLHRSESAEGTVLKFTQRVPGRGGAEVETESVLIPMIGRKRVRSYTLCVSSQVGCAMGCTFCQTAQMGLVRSLTTAEIVAQWWAARWLVPRPDPDAAIRNIVFMGMGEPLDNLDAVAAAIDVLTDHRGPAIPVSRITVSTVGRVDGLRRLAELARRPGWHRLGLAVSLNAPDDRARSALMPVNRRYPLGELRRALEQWPVYAGAHLCLEYVLIPGVNDRPEHAAQVAAFVLGRDAPPTPPAADAAVTYPGDRLRAMVNVIPYNPRHDSPWPAPDDHTTDRFLAALIAHGVFAKRRRTKGRDTMAACGQLGNLAYRRRA
jgi:23S rRNA (adenine2503-C2)-methyltransferase